MTKRKNDLVLSGVLLLIAAVWTVTVWRTIPGGFSQGDIGARGFPLVLGIALFVLSTALGAKALRVQQEPDHTESPKRAGNVGVGSGGSAAAMVVCHIVVYGLMFERLGFLLSTLLIVPSMLFFCVKERTAWKLAAYGISTALVAWLLFSKLMGVHLPMGSWLHLG